MMHSDSPKSAVGAACRQTGISNQCQHPTDAKTGLTLPLSKSLGSQDLARHRAMVAIELEVMAKKMDRFGWERDRGSVAHDRIVSDWMDALQDYPLEEVREACAAWVRCNSRKMPNEGDILGHIRAARSKTWESRKHSMPGEPEPERDRCSPEAAARICEEAGFSPKKFGGES